VFVRLDLFDRVVAENGALLYRPHDREVVLLTESPDERLVRYLRERDVRPLSVGRSIVATWEPNDEIVLEAIRSLGLEHQIVFNKGAVMVLPPGISKATGLTAALRELQLSAHDTVGVGDAENDHAFLSLCELSAAVANALPSLKDRSDVVLEGHHGGGVVELVEMILGGELQRLADRLPRLIVPLGESDGRPVGPHGRGALSLLAGASGAGKSTLTVAFLEWLVDRGYQVCLVDPEGDYEHLEHVVVLGTADRPPTLDEVRSTLGDPDRSVVVNLLGLAMEDRPSFTDALLTSLRELRTLVGRPHWIVIDEAHHVMPSDRRQDDPATEELLEGMLLITVHPDRLPGYVLGRLDLLAAIGPEAGDVALQVARAAGLPTPERVEPPGHGRGLLWRREEGATVEIFDLARPRQSVRRHRRKYAAGDLGPRMSFWFRGPDDRLALQAQNLAMFGQMGDGVDDETWMFHLRRGDYSAWIRAAIKDEELADEVAAVEADTSVSPAESRRRIREAMSARYTAPA
jgi:hydroxymethylpyrimidine pyrophosphatase-like HAD family hydrolase